MSRGFEKCTMSSVFEKTLCLAPMNRYTMSSACEKIHYVSFLRRYSMSSAFAKIHFVKIFEEMRYVTHVTIFLDAKRPAAAYVAISRVKHDDRYLIAGRVKRRHFQPPWVCVANTVFCVPNCELLTKLVFCYGVIYSNNNGFFLCIYIYVIFSRFGTEACRTPFLLLGLAHTRGRELRSPLVRRLKKSLTFGARRS